MGNFGSAHGNPKVVAHLHVAAEGLESLGYCLRKSVLEF